MPAPLRSWSVARLALLSRWLRVKLGSITRRKRVRVHRKWPVERHRRRGIEARGEQAFLHAWKTNHSAISLYEGLGFKIRTEVNVAVLKRSGVVAQ
jgi:hypothetical protein